MKFKFEQYSPIGHTVTASTNLMVTMKTLTATMIISTPLFQVDKCTCQQVGWPAPEESRFVFMSNLSWYYNMTEEEYLVRHHPNLPMAVFRSAIEGTRCHLMPTILSIEWVNEYWQRTQISARTTFLLYSAIYDNRPLTDLRPCIRLVGLSMSTDPEKGFCYLWFNATGPPEISQVERIEYVDWQGKSKKRWQPYILACRVPTSVAHLVPVAASVVEKPCIPASNVLQVIGAKERNPATAFRNGKGPTDAKGFQGWSHVVCGPALFYYHNDFSIRLVEWLELYKAMGFAKAIFYVTDVHPNIERVLKHYERAGYVDVIDFTHPAPYLDEETLRWLFVRVARSELFAMQNVYYSDCVLRYMHQYRFLAHFDPDEYPFTPHHDNFSIYLDYLLASNKEGNPPSQYRLRWTYHYDDVGSGLSSANLPWYLWALRHNQREKDHQNRLSKNFKTLYDLDIITGAFAHFGLVCANGPCTPARDPPPQEAYTAHFSMTCGDYCKKSDVLEEDNFLLRYADSIKKAVEDTIKKLGLSILK